MEKVLTSKQRSVISILEEGFKINGLVGGNYERNYMYYIRIYCIDYYGRWQFKRRFDAIQQARENIWLNGISPVIILPLANKYEVMKDFASAYGKIIGKFLEKYYLDLSIIADENVLREDLKHDCRYIVDYQLVEKRLCRVNLVDEFIEVRSVEYER